MQLLDYENNFRIIFNLYNFGITMENLFGCDLWLGRLELLLILVSCKLFESISTRKLEPKKYINTGFWLIFVEVMISAFENK